MTRNIILGVIYTAGIIWCIKGKSPWGAAGFGVVLGLLGIGVLLESVGL